MTSTDSDAMIAAENEMHTLVGRLFDYYGKLESHLTAAIRTYMLEALGSDFHSEANQNLINLVASSLRMGASKDILKKFIDITGFSKADKALIDSALKQAGEIGFVRDRIAHNGVCVSACSPLTFRIHNTSNTKHIDDIEIIIIDIESMKNMSIDLINIKRLIGSILSGNGGDAIFKTEFFVCDERSPWRYRPSQLTRTRRKPQKSQTGSQPQPQPSRG